MMNKVLSSLFLILFFSCSFVYAGLSVYPAATNVMGDPGTEYKSYYQITNTYEKDIYAVPELSEGKCFSGNKNIDVDATIKFEKEKYLIPAGQTVTIPYKVFVNKNFKGSVSVRVSFKAEKDKEDIINIVISVPVYIMVLGTEKISFNIDSVDIFNSGDNICYRMTIENNGNVHIRHTGCIEIYKDKNLIRELFIAETAPTYCESKREFKDIVLPTKDLSKGKYTAIFKVNALNREATKAISFKVDKFGMVSVLEKNK